MKGRPGDAWQRRVASAPNEEFVHTLAEAGFAGIYLDRAAFAAQGTGTEAELTRLLGPPKVVSRDQRLILFDLTPCRAARRLLVDATGS
jgi:hypothetical protein